MRKFTARLAAIYFIAVLAINFTGSIPMLKTPPVSYLFMVLSLVILTPLLFGCIRGVVTRDYDFRRALGAFGETDKYPAFLSYICLSAAFEIVDSLIRMLSSVEGAATLASVLSAITIIISIPIKFLLVGILFEAIFEEGKPFSIMSAIKKFIGVLTGSPIKIVVAEIFNIIVNYFSLYVSIMLAELLPAHWASSVALTCVHSVQFGFIAVTLPIYYLYCKAAYGITAFDEPKGRR